MSRRARARITSLAWAAAVAGLLAHLAWSTVAEGWAADRGAATAAFVGFVTVGALVTYQRPTQLMGWVFVALGLVPATHMAAQTYAREAAGGSAVAAGWFASVALYPFMVLLLVVAPLLFPDGRLPSLRWRPVLWGAGACIVVGLLQAFRPGPLDLFDGEPYAAANPLGVTVLGPVLDLVGEVFFPAVMLLSLLAVVSLGVRFHRSGGDERRQIMWVLLAVALLLVALAVDEFVLGWLGVDSWLRRVLSDVLVALALAFVPVAAGVAVLKHRLYAIDTIINRLVVYAALAGLVTGGYAAVLLLAGTLTGEAAGELPGLVAVTAAAVTFHPLRTRLQRSVNRVMYGDRHDPLSAVARLGRPLADAPDAELLPAVLEAIATTVRTPAVLVHDRCGAVVASCGGPTPAGEPVVVPLRHTGESLGTLVVARRSTHEPYTAADRRMIEALAPQVGVVLRAVELNAQLDRARIRVLAATEEERSRLRRDLHDGLGPSLSGVGLGLEAAETAIGTDTTVALDLLARLRTEVAGSIEEVRRIIEGLRPLSLDELGLVRAVRARAADITARTAGRGRPLLVEVTAPQALAALPPEVELAAYRIVDEALTNVVRHTGASRCRVDLQVGADGEVRLQITDDGGGLIRHGRDRRTEGGVGIPSMRARAEALGGRVEVASAGGGVAVTACLPAGGQR